MSRDAPTRKNAPDAFARHMLMVEMRAFEEACLEGFKLREIHGELHLGIGQEAIAAGMAEHLRPDDAVVSTHRNHLHGLAKGVSREALLAEIFERADGLCGGYGGHMHPFDPQTHFSATGIVGSSIPVALGYAYSFAMDAATDQGRSQRVAVAVTGDGGTNIGAFHESLNMAAAWALPLVVLVENNGWAISVPFEAVFATPTIAERASAYDIATHRVDGRDVAAVADAMGTAMDSARAGNGPVIVEAVCARFRGHYEGDADTYRPRDERQRMKREDDPLQLSRASLISAGMAQEAVAEAEADMRGRMTTILAQVRAMPFPDAAHARAHVFAGDRP